MFMSVTQPTHNGILFVNVNDALADVTSYLYHSIIHLIPNTVYPCSGKWCRKNTVNGVESLQCFLVSQTHFY